ncbi:hypothetical protein BGW36DRAFT_355563 [Talaromyces proteolyticus]|uniref:Uncharacterized protein n=1 Tax=Talaromyces proteolyticus TaxID=1131652 RepID=A0AAD4L274_9EURO|nr:uncharacterized protein BGW36DRAFT_355563 [Talaromyces proteolyticus]KAH8704190.1 hypothetical protein BGW36DRAFT_355563 [Talaromyces proteolyticus]
MGKWNRTHATFAGKEKPLLHLEIVFELLENSMETTQNPIGKNQYPLRLATRSEVDYKGYKTEHQDNTPFREETFNQECFPDGYTVLGNLVLPRPTGEHKELAERWEGELQKLNKRDMKELRDRPINDLNEAFTRFQDREVSTWKAHQEERSPTHLVKPSGCLESPLALRLNQPSFTSDNIDNGETADPSNGCMAMVMGSGYHADNLLFDHVHRRSNSSEAIDEQEFPADVLQCHEQFTDDIANSMTAKVEVLFGVKVQKRLLARQAFEFATGENNDRRDSDDWYTSIPWEEGYYSNKLWLGHIPFAARSTLECRAIGHQISQGQRIPKPTILKVDDDIELTPEQQYDRGSCDARFFSEKPWSNQELRELIPPALAALETAGLSSANWSLPTDLPDPVLYWLKGQKHILFSKTPISSLEDVANTLLSILPRVLSIDADSTKEILKQTMIHQEAQLGEVKLSHQQFWHSRFDGSVVKVFCGTCGHYNQDSRI